MLVPIAVALSGPNAETDSSVTELTPGGYITSVQPLVKKGTGIHGRYYAQVLLHDGAGPFNLAAVRACIWSGYVTTPNPPASVCSIRIYAGLAVVIRVFAGSNATATDQIDVNLKVEDSPGPLASQGDLFFEIAGTGPGELRAVEPADPAAGANFATLTVPALVRWFVRSGRFQIVTSASAANRLVAVFFLDATPKALGGGISGAFIVASSTVVLIFGVGLTNNHTNDLALGVSGERDQFSLSQTFLPTGFAVQFFTVNIQVGDAETALALEVEEWAVPNP